MDILTMFFWVATLVWFAFSVRKDRHKTFDAVKMSGGMMKSMAGEIIAILFLIGLILTFIPSETIKQYMGGSNTLLSTIAGAFLGSITLIPAFVAFPLIGSILRAGASIVPAVAFLTTLTMVGVVTFPLEKREFGKKFAIVRNALSFIGAIAIALLMGVIV